MTEYARKLLDELMGPDRNKRPSELGTGGVKFYDANVCKYFVVEFCPYQLFLNTKSDIGSCPRKYHEELHREKFRAEGEKYREEYEREFFEFVDKLVSDLEKKLRRGRDRLDVRPNDPTIGANPENDEMEERRTLLNLQVKEHLKKIEEYGEHGRVQEAQDLMVEVDRLKSEIERLRQSEADNPLYRLEKRMEVCMTCGAFLIVGDAQKRIDAHYEGRQHNGWARVRQALIEYKTRHPQWTRDETAVRARPRSPPPTRMREAGEIGGGSGGFGESRDRYRPRSPPRDHGGYDDRRRGGRPDRDRDRDRRRYSRSPPRRR